MMIVAYVGDLVQKHLNPQFHQDHGEALLMVQEAMLMAHVHRDALDQENPVFQQGHGEALLMVQEARLMAYIHRDALVQENPAFQQGHGEALAMTYVHWDVLVQIWLDPTACREALLTINIYQDREACLMIRVYYGLLVISARRGDTVQD